jgi:hypothetical protein
MGRAPRPPGSGRPQRGQKHPRRGQGGAEDLRRLGPALSSRLEYLPQSFNAISQCCRHLGTDPDPRIRTVPLTNGSGSDSFLQ